MFFLPKYKRKIKRITFNASEKMQQEKKGSIFLSLVGSLLLLFIIFVSNASASSVVSPVAKTDSPSIFKRILNTIGINQDNSKTVTLPDGSTVAVPDLKGLFTKNINNKNYITQQTESFMSLAPDSPDRAKKEVALFKYLKDHNASAADVLLAADATASKPARAWAMELLWQMRQSGKLTEFNINPLPQDKIGWAKQHGVDPRMLAITIDLYGPTMEIIKAKPDLFFEAAKDTKAKDPNVSNYIPNPAVIAKLQMSETGWKYQDLVDASNQTGIAWQFPDQGDDMLAFVNIGETSAYDALNLDPAWFPSGHDDLNWIAKNLQDSTGLPYVKNIEQIPGSARGDGDGSGGAIGPQFMPINARLFMGWYQQANSQLGDEFPAMNPFNPWMGTELAYLYLSSEFYHRQANVNDVLTDVVRPGYQILDNTNTETPFDPSTDPRMKALLKWNPLDWEAANALSAGQDFSSIWRSQDLTQAQIVN